MTQQGTAARKHDGRGAGEAEGEIARDTVQPGKAPTSLRERKKKKKRAAILKATRELLLKKGYDKTTMEAIAEGAEVGVATVYKYFGTKDGLVMELVTGDMEEMLDEVGRVVADPPADLPAALVALLAPPNNLQLARSKEGTSLVRHVIDAMWYQRGRVWQELAHSATSRLRQSIEDLLAEFQRRGVLVDSVDTRAAARIVYTLLDYNYICYSRGEILTTEEMAELTNKQVRMLFENWCA